ncbi:DUF5988 family protein [Nocardia sp. NPDC052112]|uniref:DUF5988 family protein n=1 Tax=Nocardia sp. NPDC052112 TaxID=3155646 RepID=UPI0034244DC2
MFFTGGPVALNGPYWVADTVLSDRLTVDHHSHCAHFEQADRIEVIDGQLLPVYMFSYLTAVAE